jgi:basic amino acid/polyamine antiporter, APA family
LQPVNAPRTGLGLGFGIGLVISNMVGAGVFLSAGYMAQELAPGPLMLAWLLGAALALCGAMAYAELSRLVQRNGGEYRYLSQLVHPAVGSAAGWASLLVGFAAPIAVDALAAGAFAHVLVPALPERAVAALLVGCLTLAHAVGLRSSARTQDALALAKVVLVVGFAAIGLARGDTHWPTWSPPVASTGFPFTAFLGSLFFVSFAFSGWNAAAYASEEFAHPARDVPRAMLWGCALVALLYLVVNFVFIANLTPEAARPFTQDAQVTLGHVVMQKILGPVGANVMSTIILVTLVSAVSAMTMVGPRIYAAMAQDGALPSVFAGQAGQPPRFAVFLQGALALLLVFTSTLKAVLASAGALLSVVAAFTMLGLLRARARGLRPSALSLVAAAIYVAATAVILGLHLVTAAAAGDTSEARLLGLALLVAAAATAAYAVRGST